MSEVPTIPSEHRLIVLEPHFRYGKELLEEVQPRPRKEPIIPQHYTWNIFDKPRNKNREPRPPTKRQAHQASHPVRGTSSSNLGRVSNREINILRVSLACSDIPVLVENSFNLPTPQTGVTDQPSHESAEAKLEMNSTAATFSPLASDFLTGGLPSREEVQNDEYGFSISREQHPPQMAPQIEHSKQHAERDALRLTFATTMDIPRDQDHSDVHQVLDPSQTAITSSNNTCSHSFKMYTIVTCMTCGYFTSPDFSQEMSPPASRDDNAQNPTQASETAWHTASAPGPGQYQTHSTIGEPTSDQFQDTIFSYSGSPNISNELYRNSNMEHGSQRCMTRPRLQIPTRQCYRQPPSSISGSTSASSTSGSDFYRKPASAAFPDLLSPRIDITDFDSFINI